MSATVLIASPEHLATLTQHSDLSGALAFADADALRALDVITRQRPGVVALEKVFASTSRGTALINRIKADPALAACEIRVVDAGSRAGAGSGAAEAAPRPAAAAAAPPPMPAAPLDQRGTRRAPRVRVVEGVEVLVDGNPATLIDVSLVGAQVVSPTVLKPNQRVRLTLPDNLRPIRFSAGIAWAAFEMPKGGPRYRAGIEFFDADTDAVGRFIESNRKGQ